MSKSCSDVTTVDVWGSAVMESVMEKHMFSPQEWVEMKQDLALPPRQADVVEHLLMGHSDKQIARDLGMSVPTVRTHLCRLFSRLGVQDRCELIVYVCVRFREKCQAYGCPRAFQ
jgi:DNA-binding NarL/FixJ family response regulator